jgi:hypothetical protein
MAQKYYIKATLNDGVSGYESTFHYHLGQNIHPKPDRKSSASCGEGIHLFKTFQSGKKYVPKATEFYIAEAGVILGEDEKKIRCASCDLILKLSKAEAQSLDSIFLLDQQKRDAMAKFFPGISYSEPICGLDWLAKHMDSFTLEDFNKQGMELLVDGKTRTLVKAGMRKKDITTVIKAILPKEIIDGNTNRSESTDQSSRTIR